MESSAAATGGPRTTERTRRVLVDPLAPLIRTGAALGRQEADRVPQWAVGALTVGGAPADDGQQLQLVNSLSPPLDVCERRRVAGIMVQPHYDSLHRCRRSFRAYSVPMEAVLATVALLSVLVLALVLLSRTWVRSSRLGGYRATHATDEPEQGPQVPEDDDARWHWRDDAPKP